MNDWSNVDDNHKLDVMNNKSYPDFPGRKRFIMRKDFSMNNERSKSLIMYLCEHFP